MKTVHTALSVLGVGIGFFISSPADGIAQAKNPSPIEVSIGVIPEALQFDQTEFSVQVGQTVRLTFDNSQGVMQHNLLVTPPGKSQTVAMAAINMGEEGPKRDYIPDSPLVLHATRLLNSGESQTLEFTAPTTPGDYDYLCSFPGHGFTMVGTMQVRASEGRSNVPEQGAEPSTDAEAPPTSPDADDEYLLQSKSEPIFVRTFLPPSSPRAIAVGLPSGQAYCFDAADCALLYGWTADEDGFLNMEPVWNGRGGKPAAVLGTRFYEAPNICPVRLDAPDETPQVAFQGYEVIGGIPELHYRVDRVLVKERITSHPTGTGLVRTFKVAKTDRAIWYVPAHDEEIAIKTTQGTRDGERFRIAPHGPVQFQIAISTD